MKLRGFILKLNDIKIDIGLNKLIFIFVVFVMSFLSFGSFPDTFNQSILILILGCFLLCKNLKNIKNINFGYTFYSVIIILLIMFLVNFFSILPDIFRSWVRYFIICSSLFFCLVGYLYFIKEESLIFFLKVISFFSIVHLIYLSYMIFYNKEDIYNDLIFFGNVRHY